MIFSSQLGRWATVVAVFVVVGAFAGARGLRPALAACSDPDRYWYGTSGNDSKTDSGRSTRVQRRAEAHIPLA